MTGEIRKEIFVECMQLAAEINKATTQHYNDLDDVVDSCSTQAYYMANQIN
jgi:D-ribose pyranose/furanose isomerase RbsD